MFQLFTTKSTFFRLLFRQKNTKYFSTNNNFFKRCQYTFGTTRKSKKIIQLNSSTIQIQQSSQNPDQEISSFTTASYYQHKQKLQSVPWETMSFDQLCSLQPQLIKTLQIQLKKDKFNISDQQFLQQQLKNRNKQALPLATYQNLSKQYKKIFTLLKNTNDYFIEYSAQQLQLYAKKQKERCLNEIYITDLKNDKELIQTIAKFIKNISKPEKLQAYTEPTFVKYLLSKKRELLLQGIKFQTKKQKAQSVKKGQVIVRSQQQSIQQRQLPSIKILQVLNFQYQFWQDIKHNRLKNGTQQNFIMQTKQIPNPNQSILLTTQFPTIKMKYIARIKPLKDGQRCFCIKVDLSIQINQNFKRRIKVEWKGPSNRMQDNVKQQKGNTKINKKSKSQMVIQQAEQKQLKIPRVNYLIIDYQNIYDGNPTIKPIFYF